MGILLDSEEIRIVLNESTLQAADLYAIRGVEMVCVNRSIDQRIIV